MIFSKVGNANIDTIGENTRKEESMPNFIFLKSRGLYPRISSRYSGEKHVYRQSKQTQLCLSIAIFVLQPELFEKHLR